jgi:hypothetical protein
VPWRDGGAGVGEGRWWGWDEGNSRWRGTVQRRWKSEGKRQRMRSRRKTNVVVVDVAAVVVDVVLVAGGVWIGCDCCCCFSFGGMVILIRMQDAGRCGGRRGRLKRHGCFWFCGD